MMLMLTLNMQVNCDADRILFNSNNEILYSSKIKEVLFNKDGKEIKKQDPKEKVPNVRDDTPHKWTGKFLKERNIKKICNQ